MIVLPVTRREKNPQSASDKYSALQPENTLDRRGPPVNSSSSPAAKHDSQRGGIGALMALIFAVLETHNFVG